MKKSRRRLLILIFLVLIGFGLNRLYFFVTAGFNIKNIHSDFSFHPDWEVRALAEEEKPIIVKALNQPYTYLAKGCQSYAFLSQDGQYVIKFFKYHNFRLHKWLQLFPPLPAIVQYREEKFAKKQKNLDTFIKGWKVAFENLKEETGLLFVHLNKTTNLQQNLTILDKIGSSYQIPLDQMEFCVQKRATLLCQALLNHRDKGELVEAQQVISRLIHLIVSEYQRGIADTDYSLMQNTGVVDGRPIHIDVGQFVITERVKNPEVYHQELFTKTFKFRNWLAMHYPELKVHLENELRQVIGSAFETMQPKFKKK